MKFKKIKFLFKIKGGEQDVDVYLIIIPVGLLQFHVLEAVLAEPEFGDFSVLLWVGAEVPGVDLESADLDSVNELDLGEGLVLLLEGGGRRVHLGKRLLHVVDLVMFAFLVSAN